MAESVNRTDFNTALAKCRHNRAVAPAPGPPSTAATACSDERCVGVTGISSEVQDVCAGRTMGKMSRARVPKEAQHRATEAGERIFTDLQGPMQTLGTGGAKYIINFVDEATGMTLAYFLKQNNSAHKALADFLNIMETEGRPVKYLRSDGGGEYVDNDFQSVLRSKGVRTKLTNQDSRTARERNNRTVVEMARSMLRRRPQQVLGRGRAAGSVDPQPCTEPCPGGQNSPRGMVRHEARRDPSACIWNGSVRPCP